MPQGSRAIGASGDLRPANVFSGDMSFFLVDFIRIPIPKTATDLRNMLHKVSF